MSTRNYRIVIACLILVFLFCGLGVGAWVELLRASNSQVGGWERAAELADFDRGIQASRILFVAVLAGLIGAFFYRWQNGSRRGQLFLVLAIGGLFLAWGAAAFWTEDAVDNALPNAQARRPAGLPRFCDDLYVIDPETGSSKPADSPPPGGLDASKDSASTDSVATIVLNASGFHPADVSVPPDKEVELYFFNGTETSMRFYIDALHIMEDWGSCHVLEISINAPTGDYTFRARDLSISYKEEGVTGLLHVAADWATPSLDAAPSATTAATDPSSGTPVTTVQLLAGDIFFEPDAFTIPSNTDVTIALSNSGVALHNFSITGTDINVDIPPGEITEVVMNLPAGEYQFFCNRPGHLEAGMVGTLRAVD